MAHAGRFQRAEDDEPWVRSSARARLQAIYAEVDDELAGAGCPGSTRCCRFGETGREPYVTEAEVRELRWALGSVGLGGRRTRRLAQLRVSGLADEDCPLLSADGRCRIYASRPLGCRTYYCADAHDAELPRLRIRDWVHALETLAAELAPGDAGARPLRSIALAWSR